MVLHLLIFLLWYVSLLSFQSCAVGSPLRAKVNSLFLSQEAAQAMMDRIGDDGLVVGGRKVFFEYRSVLHCLHLFTMYLSISWTSVLVLSHAITE